MKKFKNWLVCLLLAVCCVGLVACGNKNNVNLNTKPEVSIQGDFKETEADQVVTVLGTKKAPIVDSFNKYKVYTHVTDASGNDQEATMALEFNNQGVLVGMAIKMTMTYDTQKVTANVYYKDSLFYINATTNYAGVTATMKYKFDPTKSYGEQFKELTESYISIAENTSTSRLLDDIFEALENSNYFKFEKTEDNTKFKLSKKENVELPDEMYFTDLNAELELKDGKLNQLKITANGSVTTEILLTKIDQNIAFPNFDDYTDILSLVVGA